jgi:ABC-2 type transport system permease protein
MIISSNTEDLPIKDDQSDNMINKFHNLPRIKKVSEKYQLINEPSWRSGLSTLVKTETKHLLKNRKWLFQLFLMIFLNNIFFLLIILTNKESEFMILEIFTTFMTTWTALSTVIVMQGAIVNEKTSGTAEWVLSKPVSRNAFILGKIINNTLALSLFIFLIPGIIGIIEIITLTTISIEVWRLFLVILLCWFHGMFYLLLIVMLGVIMNNRITVMGVSLVYLFGQDFLVLFMENGLPVYFVRSLVIPGEKISLTFSILYNLPIESWIPLIFTIISCIVFIIIAIWRFNKLDL